ncbi:hypothetical protein L7F22_057207 [Adiantum nelumboides]|nr:hypothetical protein [Adiantum nelumboides]
MLAKDLTKKEEEDSIDMFKRYLHVFIIDYSIIKGVKVIQHHIDLKLDTKPVAQNLRRLGVVQQEALLAERDGRPEWWTLLQRVQGLHRVITQVDKEAASTSSVQQRKPLITDQDRIDLEGCLQSEKSRGWREIIHYTVEPTLEYTLLARSPTACEHPKAPKPKHPVIKCYLSGWRISKGI